MTDENHLPTVARDKCGSNAGYHAHVSRLERACPECAEAHREYVRAWRTARTPEQLAAKRHYDAARQRAMTRLARRHRRELDDYIEEELKQ